MGFKAKFGVLCCLLNSKILYFILSADPFQFVVFFEYLMYINAEFPFFSNCGRFCTTKMTTCRTFQSFQSLTNFKCWFCGALNKPWKNIFKTHLLNVLPFEVGKKKLHFVIWLYSRHFLYKANASKQKV